MKPSKRRIGRPLEPYDNVLTGPWPLPLCEGCREHRPVRRCIADNRPAYLLCERCIATEAGINHALKTARHHRRALERW